MRPLVVALLLLCGCVQIDPTPSPVPPGPVPAPVDPKPAPSPRGPLDLSRVAELVRRSDKAIANKYAAGWLGLAYALERGEVVGKPVKTTGDLAKLIADFEELNWQGTDVAGFCPGISDAINAAMVGSLGDDDRELSPGEASAVIRKIGEACQR